MQHDRHPDNAPGEFYVDPSCCLQCRATSAEAPGLFGTDAGSTCFVRRQPTGQEETYRMLRAMRVAEAGGVRHAGDDEAMLRRIAEAGMATACDKSCARTPTPVRRDTVRIGACSGDSSGCSRRGTGTRSC